MFRKIFFATLSMVAIACNQTQNEASTKENASRTLSDAQIIQTAKDGYIFGFPLVVMNVSRQVMTNVKAVGPAGAPVNQLQNLNFFPDDKFTAVVRPNNDTYYSTAWMDLSGEPMVLQLPNTNGRYFLMPMLDAWTNIFFSPGKRTTGTEAQTILITGPRWTGNVPPGMKNVKAPTNLIWMIGRTQVNSAQDGATTVKKIQDGYKLVPLSGFDKAYTAPEGVVDPNLPNKAPNDIVIDMPIADYFNLLNKLMQDNSPTVEDSAIMKSLSSIGITPGANFDLSKFSAAVQDSLKAIPVWAKQYMFTKGLSNAKMVNGWAMNRGLGSYGTNYDLRAGVAFGGLGANLDADAMYPASLVDADGDAYDGSKHRYVIHFDVGQTPPSNAFWSLTMYNENGFLCANPINRFAIGDRNPLKKNADGSIDIYIQNENPGKDKVNNWLPAPKAPFNLLLRVYWPKDQIINGSWQVPGVKKQL